MDKEILSMEEAAALFDVSVKTFIKLLKEEKVPARKIGREWRFSRKALIEWLSSGDSQTYSASEGETKEFFNAVAPEWDSLRKEYDDEAIKNKLMEMNILRPEMTVVDLGAGSGYVSRTVAKHVKKVIAVDISAEMLKELRKKATDEGICNIEFVENDGQDVSVNDASVDIIFASMYLHHIENPLLAIKEMGRMIRADGLVVLADFNSHCDDQLKEKMHDLWPGFNHEDVKRWFNHSGFKEIQIETLPTAGKMRGAKDKASPSIFVMTARK